MNTTETTTTAATAEAEAVIAMPTDATTQMLPIEIIVPGTGQLGKSTDADKLQQVADEIFLKKLSKFPHLMERYVVPRATTENHRQQTCQEDAEDTVEITTTGAEAAETVAASTAPVIQMLPIESVVPDPDQPRKYIDDEKTALLADSIRTHGIIQPLTTRLGADGKIYIVCGERRFRAAKLLGFTELPCVMNTGERYEEVSLVENCMRVDLTAIEKAEACQRLVDSGIAKKDVAALLGKAPSTISDVLSLLKLKPEIKEICRKNGDYAIRELKQIAVAPEEDQDAMFEKYQRKMKQNMRLSINKVAARGKSIEKAAAMLGGQLEHISAISDKEEREKVLLLLRDLINKLSGVVAMAGIDDVGHQSPEGQE